MRALRAALLALALAAPAGAQDASRADAFAGYSLLAADGQRLHGWHAALGWRISGRLAILLDASGHGGSDAEGSDLDAFALMAGPRLAFGDGRVRPFVHVIAGFVRTRSGIEVFDVDIGETATAAAGAAGGGVDVGLGDRWAVRGAADYRVLEKGGETTGDPRFSIGAVYRFGR